MFLIHFVKYYALNERIIFKPLLFDTTCVVDYLFNKNYN